ncbi:molybdopterin-binding protein [Cytobacillus firmus]
MENIIAFKGNVKYQITLDPGVWIFDDRRVDLTTYFMHEHIRKNELEEYTKAVSKHWDREIMEGAVFPPTLKTEKKFEKEKVLTGTFGIPFKPFLMNAEPDESAEIVVIESEDGETRLTLSEAEELILGFSKDGKPLKEDGPVHAYLGDGSNYNSPVKRVKAFRVE